MLDLRTFSDEGLGGIILHAAGAVAQAYHLGRTAVLTDHPLARRPPTPSQLPLTATATAAAALTRTPH